MQTTDIVDFLYSRLDELNKLSNRNDFIVGEIYAYIECLEFVLSPTTSSEELIEIERKYRLI